MWGFATVLASTHPQTPLDPNKELDGLLGKGPGLRGQQNLADRNKVVRPLKTHSLSPSPPVLPLDSSSDLRAGTAFPPSNTKPPYT